MPVRATLKRLQPTSVVRDALRASKSASPRSMRVTSKPSARNADSTAAANSFHDIARIAVSVSSTRAALGARNCLMAAIVPVTTNGAATNMP